MVDVTATGNNSVSVTDAEIEICQKLYAGKGTFGIFKTKKGASDSAFEETMFVHKNHFRRAINRLATVFPSTFKTLIKRDGELLKKDDPDQVKLDQFATDYFARPWEGEKNFWQSYAFLMIRRLVDGNVYHKLVKKKDGKVYPVRMSVKNVRISGDGETIKGIGSFEFQYQVTRKGVATTDDDLSNAIKETFEIGRITTETDGTPKTETFSAPFIAVVHLICDEQDESPKGRPLAMDLVDPFMEYLRTCVDVSMANVMTGNQVLVTTDAEPAGSAIGPGAHLKLKTSTTSKPDAKYIGGNLNLVSLENERDDHRRDVYLFAHVPPDMKEETSAAPSHSGKAQIILSAEQIAEVTAELTIIAAWLEEHLYKAYTLEKGGDLKREEITVVFPPVVNPDPLAQERRAQLYVDMGATQKALEELGNEPENIDSIMAQIQEGDIPGNVDENGLPVDPNADPKPDPNANPDPNAVPKPDPNGMPMPAKKPAPAGN